MEPTAKIFSGRGSKVIAEKIAKEYGIEWTHKEFSKDLDFIDDLEIEEEKVMLTSDQLARTLKLYGVN